MPTPPSALGGGPSPPFRALWPGGGAVAKTRGLAHAQAWARGPYCAPARQRGASEAGVAGARGNGGDLPA